MTEKEFADLKELINANTSLIKVFKLFAINHLNTAFALSKTVDNQIERINPNLKKYLKRKSGVSKLLIFEAASLLSGRYF